MENKLGNYIAKGLRVSLDEALVGFSNSNNQNETILKMKKIYTDMMFYKSQGVPLTRGYLKEIRSKIADFEDLRNI